MSKKFFGLLLTLCMVLAMMPVVAKPVTVQAAPVQSVKIGTAELNSTNKYYHNGDDGAQGEANNNAEGADAIFDPNTGTLTLNGLRINTSNVGIGWSYDNSPSRAHDLTIVLAENSTNTINNASGSGILGNVGYPNDGPSLTIKGSGTLNVTGKTNGIWVWHNITIQDNAKVNATGETRMGICNNDLGGTITIRDSAVVTATGNTSNSADAYGIGFDNNNSNTPVIQGGTVTMTGGTAAVMESPNLENYSGGCKVYVGTSAEECPEWNNSTPLKDYKYIHIEEGAHSHDWIYSANGATLTASCSRKSVCHVDNQTLMLTATTEAQSVSPYSGASLSDTNAWIAAGLTPPTIKYEGMDGTDYSSTALAPTAAGRYKATITAGGATAAAPFAITGTAHTLKVESGANGTAGIQGEEVTSAAIGCYADVTLTATPNNGYRLKQWVVSGSSITITNNKFIMPDCDVTVTAEFEIKSAGGGGSNPGGSDPSGNPGGSTGGNTGDYYIPPTTTDNDTKTDTTTLPDGTKVETSKTTDETTGATTVEEKKTALDGTVTEMKTTTQKDGSSETTSKETRTDGSTTETNTTVDTEGTSQSVVRDKDFPTGDLLTIRKTEEQSGEVSYVLATLLTEEATIVKAKVERAEALANMKNIPYRVKVLDENGKLDYKVRVNTGDVKANQTLYVYKYDSKTKSFGLVQADYQKVKADEKANIICDFENLISTQRYQLVTKSKAGLLDKKILATVKAKIGQKSLKVNQSTSFKLDEKLNLENVSTIKYSTSDKQVVKVSKAGKITGKNTGTADIKATITLINGKTKTVRMKIKVK